MNKNIFTMLLLASFTFCASHTFADTLTERYGVNIQDTNGGDDSRLNLNRLFNSMFKVELAANNEGPYTTSNDLFNARGVDPNMVWTTNDSSLAGAFKVAGYGHELSIISGNQTVKTMSYLPNTSTAPTSGIVTPTDGMYSLAGFNAYDISNIKNAVWQLDVHKNNDAYVDYSLFSSSGLNSDGLTHMITFDITDLYNAKTFGTDKASYVNTAYMFAWEDIMGGGDYDFQDFVGIVTNVYAAQADINGNASTPEPATLAIMGLGLLGAGFAARRKRAC